MNKEELEFFLKSINGIIRTRGKDIYQREKIVEYTVDEYDIQALVETSSEDGFYDVDIKYNQFEDNFVATCTCAYFESNFEDCKHIAAVAFIWLDLFKGIASKNKPAFFVKKEQPINVIVIKEFKEFNFKVKGLNIWDIFNFLDKREKKAPHNPNQLKEDKNEKKVSLAFKDGINATAKYISNGVLALGCNCGNITANRICIHIYVLLERTSSIKGNYYFNQYNDYTANKNAILKDFGLKVGDAIAEKFEFNINHWGELELLKQPKNILKLADYDGWQNKIKSINPISTKEIDLKENNKIPADIKNVGLVILMGGKYNLTFWVEGVAVIGKKTGGSTYKRISLQNNNDLAVFSHLPNQVLTEIGKLTTDGLIAYLKEIIPELNYYYSVASIFNRLSVQARITLTNYIANVLTKLIGLQHPDLSFFTVDEDLSFSNANCKPINFSLEVAQIELVLLKKHNFLELSANLKISNKIFALSDVDIKMPLLYKTKADTYLIDEKDKALLGVLENGNLMVHENEAEAFINKVVNPLNKNYPIQFDDMLNIKDIHGTDPTPSVYLSELNDSFLMIRPKWKYDTFEVEMDDRIENLYTEGEKIYKIQRNTVKEQELIENIKTLHNRFKLQNGKEYFYLPFSEVMEKNWFLKFFENLQNLNVPVYGINDLKKFKYNSNKPVLKVSSSSGIDWFDLEIEIQYGEEVVGLAELKKAILSKQQYILLKDGTLGILPEEWIKKYSPLLRMGHVNGHNLKISKLHYTLLDELYNQLDDVEIQEELNQKRQNLGRIGNTKEIALPKNIEATLRDYQLAGYQWMHQLRDLGWGGCLADDMGLGKTLQTLTFLLDCIAKKPKETHFIVCPTSLIYNWESEIQKFTPNLKYYIHYGTDRHISKEKFVQNNLIITSYGMVRSDIEHLSALKFGYLILDESQAIKNPSAQITKAVQILKSNNRLILSGTPVQNNTFDLYSQMNFLNPGMLGNMEFFKSEFATPIDKYGDKDKSEELRKMIYPFMLRRTKEQVAKDLPDKTEMVLWCEMDTAQRKVYDYYKNYYRDNLMQRIADDGMGKSSIYILEGLLKLRQICDSPALLKDEKFKNDSVKLAELVRELEDNTGTHKVLVFSQFVEMLSLIRNELDKHKINYSYLDGATPAIKRKEAVKNFQEDENIRVFLISLKAGGVGLNLTSADYVYLVDPWWNPAAEQQAIDRTHRIGQINKVFAYKMICKDTVEEKILQLQQKKKALAGDLIADEAGFVKKLTKDDVAFLFS